jgi:hypothetical protein
MTFLHAAIAATAVILIHANHRLEWTVALILCDLDRHSRWDEVRRRLDEEERFGEDWAENLYEKHSGYPADPGCPVPVIRRQAV